jgi:hypothetical protein
MTWQVKMLPCSHASRHRHLPRRRKLAKAEPKVVTRKTRCLVRTRRVLERRRIVKTQSLRSSPRARRSKERKGS